jgi:integrase
VELRQVPLVTAAVMTNDPEEDAEYRRFRKWKEWERSEAEETKKPPAPLVTELWERWFVTISNRSRAPHVRSQYERYVVGMEFTWLGQARTLGSMRISECTTDVFGAWMAALREQYVYVGAGQVRTDRKLSAGYLDLIRMNLQGCLAYHLENGAIANNPLVTLDKERKYKTPREGYYEDEEKFDEFLIYVRPIVADMMRFKSRNGGLRRDECRLLKKSEVKWDASEIHLSGKRRKNGRPVIIFVTSDGMEILRRWAASNPASEFVFSNPNDREGKAIPRSTMWNWIAEGDRDGAPRPFGGKKFTDHMCRHQYVMWNKVKGIDPGWIAKQMGASAQVVDEIYGDLRGPVEEFVRDKLNQRVAAKQEPEAAGVRYFPCPSCNARYDDIRAAAKCLDSHEAQSPQLAQRKPPRSAARFKSRFAASK